MTNPWYIKLVRVPFTALAIVGLLLAVRALWIRYQVEPVTRDGKVRADIVPVAADVAGLITQVSVQDNQSVEQGQVLLVIDPSRYTLALQQAQANLASLRITLAQAQREDARNRAMSNVVAAEVIEQGRMKVEQLRLSVTQAIAARDLAQLNLDRTVVRAPVSGKVTNMTLQPGIYLTVGKAALALVNMPSLRVEGYFEETKLQRIHLHDPVSIHLMGVPGRLRGHVESIAAAIEDRERTGDIARPADVNPAFTWVRLAQRIPVRVVIDSVPDGVRLVPGQTATIEVQSRGKRKEWWPW